MMNSPLSLWLLASASGLLARTAMASCEPELAFHPPKYESGDMQHVFNHIKSELQHQFSSGEYNDTSISIEVSSSTDSLFSYHHTAATASNGTAHVDGSTSYRIASNTKLFTALAIFQQEKAGKLSLDDSVSKFVSGLPDNINWKHVTVGRLIAHLSGIRNDYSGNDFLAKLTDPAIAGLPPASPAQLDSLPQCGIFTGNEIPCTEKDLFKSLATTDLVFPADTAVSYSNVGYDLLGLVVQNASGMDFEDYVYSNILSPLGMDTTAFDTPDPSKSVVVDNSDWGVDHGVDNAAGGLYSTTSDMIKLLQFALKNHHNISDTIDWFLPTAYSPGSHSLMGYPWEIFRTNSALPSSNRSVTFLTKGGGLDGYYSYSIVIPAYDIAVFMVAGGQLPLLNVAFQAVQDTIAAEAEKIAQKQLAAGYAGTYVASTHNDTAHGDGPQKLNSSLVIEHTPGKSLFVSSWISNSTDVLEVLVPLVAAQAGSSSDLYFQVIPTFQTRTSADGSKVGDVWRFINVLPGASDTRGGWSDYCIGNIDPLRYAGLPLNELIFWRDGDSEEMFCEVELVAFNITLSRA